MKEWTVLKKKRRNNTNREGWTIIERLITGAIRLLMERTALKRKGGTILIRMMSIIQSIEHYTKTIKEHIVLKRKGGTILIGRMEHYKKD